MNKKQFLERLSKEEIINYIINNNVEIYDLAKELEYYWSDDIFYKPLIKEFPKFIYNKEGKFLKLVSGVSKISSFYHESGKKYLVKFYFDSEDGEIKTTDKRLNYNWMECSEKIWLKHNKDYIKYEYRDSCFGGYNNGDF